jgi:hypothetical protein
MIDREQYIDAIVQQSTLYPVLADLIAEYTGGEIDVNTEEGKLCWTDHKNGDTFCWSNQLHLDNWLLPVIREMDSDTTDLLECNLATKEYSRIMLPRNITFKQLTFTCQPLDTDANNSYNNDDNNTINNNNNNNSNDNNPSITLRYDPWNKSIATHLPPSSSIVSPAVYSECKHVLGVNRVLTQNSLADVQLHYADYFDIHYKETVVPVLCSLMKNTRQKMKLTVRFEIRLRKYLLQMPSFAQSYLQSYFGDNKYNSNNRLLGIPNVFKSGLLSLYTDNFAVDVLSTCTSFIL